MKSDYKLVEGGVNAFGLVEAVLEEGEGEGGEAEGVEEEEDIDMFYDNFEERSDSFKFPKGIFTLDDLKQLGKQTDMCPYFLARRFLISADVIVYNYNYLLDPKIANLVSAELQRDCIVVFDECHNIDNACIESLSMNMNRRSLELAG